MERRAFMDRLKKATIGGGVAAVLPKTLFDAFGIEDPQVEIKPMGQVTVTNMEPGSRCWIGQEQSVMSGSYIPQIRDMYCTSSGPMYSPLGFSLPPIPTPLPSCTTHAEQVVGESGEVVFNDIPTGKFIVRVRSSEHLPYEDRLTITKGGNIGIGGSNNRLVVNQVPDYGSELLMRP